MQARAERRRELTLGPVGPWGATITVEAVSTHHGRQTSLPHDWLFEIAAEWTGPPAIGFPPSRTPVHARDVIIATDLEDAKRIARQAAAAFRHGGDEPPDLRDFLAPNRVAFAPRPPQGPDT